MLETMHCTMQCTFSARMIYLICFQCFLMGYISLDWYLLHCVLQNDHSVHALCRLTTYLRSTMGQQRFSNIALLNIERAYANSSQQWRGSHHWYLWPSKWQRQLFLWTCFMSSYDRFICKNIFTSYVGLCCCSVWPSFLFDCFLKIWATCEKFLGKWFTAPLAKNCPYDFEISICSARNLLSSTKRLLLASIPESEGLSTAESDDCGCKNITKQTIKYCDISCCKTLLVTRRWLH